VVPCRDAVPLVVLSAAIDRLGLGLTLLAAFSLGMAAVLVAVGATASRFQSAIGRSERRALWERRLGIVGALILAAIGLSLLR
jgi:cytochrome c biogenesis protein CcdA